MRNDKYINISTIILNIYLLFFRNYILNRLNIITEYCVSYDTEQAGKSGGEVEGEQMRQHVQSMYNHDSIIDPDRITSDEGVVIVKCINDCDSVL